MWGLADLLGGLAKPMVMAAVLLVGLGFLSVDTAAGKAGTGGFTCKGFTSSAEMNRMICRYHPARIWNMPVTQVLGGTQ